MNDIAVKWGQGHRLLYVVNESFFFYSHRLPIARAARDAGFEVHVAAPDDHVWAAQDFSVEALVEEGFTFHVIPLNRRSLNPLRDLVTIVALWRLYRRLRPTLLHHLTIKPVLYGGILGRLMRVKGVVNAVTGLGHLFSAREPHLWLLSRLILTLYRASMRSPRCTVIVQNEDDGAQLRQAGAVQDGQIRLIRGSGVDIDAYPESPELDGEPLVIMPARLIWAKGVAEFVAAAQLLREEGIAARFAILGDAKANYQGAVPRANLQQWHDAGIIEWWGRREDMADVFKRCHIVCLPTKYGEGVPKVLIEAAASGRATVSSDVAGCRDIVRHDVNGLLAPPGDVAALAAALRRLLTDVPYRRRLASAGRAIVEREFTDRIVINETMALYREIVSGQPRERASETMKKSLAS